MQIIDSKIRSREQDSAMQTLFLKGWVDMKFVELVPFQFLFYIKWRNRWSEIPFKIIIVTLLVGSISGCSELVEIEERDL